MVFAPPHADLANGPACPAALLDEQTPVSPTNTSELSILETALLFGFRKLPDDEARLQFLSALEKTVNP